MRPFATLRGRLIAMVTALVAVTLGGVALISTRVAHYEIRKFEVERRVVRQPAVEPLSAFFRARGSWDGVQPLIAGVARDAGAGVLLFDARRQLVAASDPALAAASISMSADGTLTIDRQTSRGRTRELLRGPQITIRDASGAAAGQLFLLPAHDASTPVSPTRALDRWFFWTFAMATLFGVIMAVAIARRISVPVERLTAAARTMESGDLAARVAPAGGAELETLAHAFNTMAETLERNEELRRRMVSDAAHELRAPLTNIRCELESMQDGLTAPTPERIASMHDETMQLARLVDDLQDLALAEAGRIELDIREVAVAALARRAAAGIESRARDRGVEMVCDGADDVIVRADAGRTVQILTNLLANAIAHMPRAGEVRIAWERRGAEVVVQVRDVGEGIAAAELERIFDRFYRVDPSRSRATGGAGLGLAIVRQLVAAQGGGVWAESEPGAGATFFFTLPAA